MRLKNKSKKLIVLICFSALIVPILSTNLIEFTTLINEKNNQASIPKVAWYNNTEAPIEIDALTANDWTWARTQPWCRKGDGSWGDPYVIENVTIDAGVIAATALDGIEIKNSQNVYFKIKNCTLFNGTIGVQAGIHLYNTSKGLLIDNDCSTSFYGIYLEGSFNNTIQGNLAHHNPQNGIRVESSSNNTLLDNRCYNNSLGIRLNDASDIIITGNKCYNNSNTGIYLDVFNYRAKIIGNDCYNNTNNGLFIFNSCQNTTVQGNNFYYNERGISLSMAYLITIEGNNCSFNTHGIFLAGSDNITIKENIVNNNKYTGIYLGDYYITFSIYSHNNKLSGNDCNYNNNGIFSDGGGNHNITGNDCDNNRYYGILLQSNSLDNKILGNNCSFNGYIGIDALDNSHRTVVIGNNCSYNNAHGMEVMNCNDFTIINNTMSQNGKTIVAYCGLSIDSSNNMIIRGNVFNDNIYAGIVLDGGNNINVSLNTCNGNNLGIYIMSGTAIEVAWNVFIGNVDCILDYGTGTNIHDNICGNRPSSFLLESDAVSPDNDGSFTLTWSAAGAINYTVYVYSSYISVINTSLGLPLMSETTDLSLPITGYSNGTYYFIVVAHNANGDTLSNCLMVTVGIPPEGPDDGVIPGYPLYLLLTFFIVITAILIKKKRENLSIF